MPSEEPQTAAALAHSLRVCIRGLDAAGKAFYQDADLLPTSEDRASIAGVRQRITIGEIIGVQLDQQKVRVWVTGCEMRPDSVPVIHVRLAADQASPWKGAWEAITASDAASRKFDRRAVRRVKIRIPVELQREASEPSIAAVTGDISVAGCYVEMLHPLPVATRLVLTLHLGDAKLTVRGMVRTSHPGVGLGVEFLGLSMEDKAALQSHLNTLSPLRRPDSGPKPAQQKLNPSKE